MAFIFWMKAPLSLPLQCLTTHLSTYGKPQYVGYFAMITMSKTIVPYNSETFPTKKGELTPPAKAIWHDYRFTAMFT